MKPFAIAIFRGSLPKDHRRPHCDERGFSLVEVLIAATILLVVSVGILPMFTHSIQNNTQGRQSTEAVNEARSELERLMQLNFNDVELTVLGGNTVLQRIEYWNVEDREWQDTGEYTPVGNNERTRTVEIRQYGPGALADELIEENEALDGGVPLTQVMLKEITVDVRVPTQLGAPEKTITLRVFRGA